MKKKSSKTEVYHILMYVLDSTPKLKKFSSMELMHKFVNKFQKKYPDQEAVNSGYWIDFVISGVTGDVTFFTDGISLE